MMFINDNKVTGRYRFKTDGIQTNTGTNQTICRKAEGF